MVTGKRAKQLGDGTWEMPGAEGIREAAGTQSDRIYIEQWQTTVAQWVALRTLFEVCARDTGYEIGGAEEEGVLAPRGDGKQLQANLEDSREAKRRRRRSCWEMGM